MKAAGGGGDRRWRRRRSDPLDRAPSQHRWIVSYADFITLLFAFFTTLYGISSVDAHKLGSAVAGFQSAFAGGPTDNAATAGRPPETPAPIARTPPTPGRMAEASPQPVPDPGVAMGPAEVNLEDVRLGLSDRLDEAVRDGRVAVELDRRGLVVSIRESGSFATGSAVVSPKAAEVIGEVAASVRQIGNLVRIEGHTDDVPIHTERYDSNWELSTARATNVVALLVQAHGLDAARLSAAGYSQFHPRAPNDSAVNRGRNRRVDIVILNPGVSRREEPDPAGLPPPGRGP
ncbi:MAG TPA: flagellar motor protein MotB [Vicinamibacterales bacterium]|nr:flagellar motor protein MotB [Vicinamibacterales bacterium]